MCYTRDKRLHLVKDTDYMVEKTDQLAPYLGFLGLFNASVTHIWFKRFLHTINLSYLSSGQKSISVGTKRPQQTIWLNLLIIYYHILTLLGPI